MKTEQKPKILLVDDNVLNLQVLRGALEELDCTLLAARSGEQALEIAKRAKPALILLDVMMPGMDGYETCDRLKSDQNTSGSAVIFLTALHKTKDKIRGLQLGAVDFITKPFDPEEVQARVSRHLELYEQHRRLSDENRSLADQLESLSLSDGDAHIRWLRSIIDSGEGARVEFKSTVRWNLQKDCADKGVEMAWLKTVVAFMNTDGGVLLIGVEDNGNILGIEADGFGSDDKLLLHVNNLIKEHVGLGTAANIRFSPIKIDGKTVLPIECKSSKEPVFLKVGNAEDFYVRLGPGTRKLSTREVIAYLSTRKPD
jgi:DNA-binding response OmpR family regulator